MTDTEVLTIGANGGDSGVLNDSVWRITDTRDETHYFNMKQATYMRVTPKKQILISFVNGRKVGLNFLCDEETWEATKSEVPNAFCGAYVGE
jgi:hypothetical protein